MTSSVHNVRIDYQKREVKVAFICDSITALYDLGVYYPDIAAVNRGISGDTTFGVERRTEISLYEIEPQLVVMLIGGNSLDTMLDNYEDILISVRENPPRSKVVLCSPTATGGAWARNNPRVVASNEEIARLAGKYGFSQVDPFTPFYDEGTGEMHAHLTENEVHPNAECYELMTGILTPILYILLEKSAKT